MKDVKYVSKADKEAIMAPAGQIVGVPGDIYGDLIRDLSQQRMAALIKRQGITNLIEKEVIIPSRYDPIYFHSPTLGLSRLIL